MGKRILPALLLLSICFTPACNLGDLGDIAVIADIEDEFQLDLWETLSPDSRTLEFRITTIKEQDCSNTYIDHRLTRKTGSFSISLRDILKPADCNPEPAPARAEIDLGALQPGFSLFSIDLKETVFNDGQLTIQNNRYRIKMESEDGVKLARAELLRVPERTIWGYVHFEKPEQQARADEFVEELRAISKPAVYQQGYYGHFTLGANGAVEAVHNQPAEGEMKRFIFSYADGETALQTLMDKYRNGQNTTIKFRLYDDKGNTF